MRVIPGHFASEESVVRHNAERVANALLALGGTMSARGHEFSLPSSSSAAIK